MKKQLPKNWVECSLGEIAEWGSGGTPNRGIPSYYNGTIPWLKTGDLNDGLITEVKEFITDLGLKNSSAKIFPKNSVVIAMYGATIGKTGVLNFDSSTNQACAVAVPYFNMNKFIYLFLKSEKENFIEKGKGGAQPNISQAVIKSHRINLPPLPEQNRIVAKIDVLFAHLEEIKTRIGYLKGISDRFTYSCLVDSKKNKFHPREKIGQFVEERTERIGENWNGLRLIGVSSKEGIIDLRIGQKESFEKYKIVKPGDFIYNTMRVNIGSIAIYKGSDNALTSPDYVVFRVSKYLSSRLLLNFLKSDQGLLEIGANTKGSVRARLYFKALSEIRMPIAPVEIQNLAENFLQAFNNNLNAINALKKAKLDKLSQSILAKAFKGELVEQLPADGDARELLKQIQKLKSEIKKKSK